MNILILVLLSMLALAPARQGILMQAEALMGRTEATGNNDGPAVDAVLASVGLEGTGAPYCAAFNRYVYDQAGLRSVGPRSALAADWVRNPTWLRGKGKIPLPGDAWGIYFSSLGRVAHTGLVKQWRGDVAITLEGNTSPQQSAGEKDRNGDGFWSKRRLTRQLYAVRNWIGD